MVRLSTKKVLSAVATLTCVGALSACSHSAQDSPTHNSGGSSTAVMNGAVNVSAAASLKGAFTTLKHEFESAHPGTRVRLQFAGSSTLATQINNGAPVDVFATADQPNMQKIGDKAIDPRIFATNTLVIVTAPGNPKGIKSFADLRKPGVKLALCQIQQPCGTASAEVERDTGVPLKPVTEEESVTAVLTKVTSGQADAGLVYTTDAKSAGDKVATVTDPALTKVVNRYPISLIRGSKNVGVAKEFINLVMSNQGREVFSRLGFGPAH